MPARDLDSALEAQRRAADAFKAAALAVRDDVWNVPRAPGKWSPAQLTDHVGVTTRVARQAVGGTARMGGIPRLFRWIPRALFFDRILVNGFPLRSRGPRVFAPAPEPKPRAELLAQLDAEVTAFEADVHARVWGGKPTFEHSFFGQIAVADYVLFNARHLDHHREQLPAS